RCCGHLRHPVHLQHCAVRDPGDLRALIHALGLSAAGVGLTLAALGVGMVLGALLSARVMRALPLGTVITIGPVCGVIAALVMALTIWLPSGMLAALSFFLMGAGPILWVVSTTTLRQTVTPEELLGRA